MIRSQPEIASILWFDGLTIDDIPRVGGKTASLGEMVRALGPKGVRIPDGFAVTADAYRRFLSSTGLEESIPKLLATLDVADVSGLQRIGQQIRQSILSAELPVDLADDIRGAYARLSAGLPEPADVAVRSSATAEDLPDASFAGQQETYLNVRGAESVLHSCKRCFASLFTDRALSYRTSRGFDHLQIALSVAIQRMVRSDLASSGVMFTIDTETGFSNAVLINASYGLGETIVQGAVNPDEFTVFKPTLKLGARPILHRILGSKEFKLVYDVGGERMVKSLPVPQADRERFSISDDDILQLARWGCMIEDHYSEKRGHPAPMDIEWAKDGRTGELYIVQARPETVQARKSEEVLERFELKRKPTPIITGRSVGERIGAGPARIVRDVHELKDFRPGEVLIADKTDPDWEPVMQKAVAIVTNRGGRTCHAAIVSRELGLPAVVGTGKATELIHDGQDVTVSCSEGETGSVYEGILPFDINRVDLKTHARPRTRIMMNVGNPTEAFRLSFLPNDGVGLAREEFIISTFIKIHPMALIRFAELKDAAAKAEIERLTAGYADKPLFFVDKLAEGVAMIAAAFYPKDVIVRLSDFKTNEYAGLVGGRDFEPSEENPMIGFRGASRYYDPRYRDAFRLECLALRKVRDEMGLTNVKVMVPFCRTVQEGRKVESEMERHGLRRGERSLEIYVMCEIPSNVVLAEQFAEVFDGFSIGSNDLTQLTLGVDRDSEIIAHLFDERNEAVTSLIRQVIRAARSKGRKIGICGQAPSDYPEFARFLVEEGIDSISLNPDAVIRTTLLVRDTEKALGIPARA
jgi:pyruvate, water dikinase